MKRLTKHHLCTALHFLKMMLLGAIVTAGLIALLLIPRLLLK